MIELPKDITPHPVGVKHTSRFVDITGRKFGMLQVIEYAGRRKNQGVWFCRCDCGTERFFSGHKLLIGWTKSCGCAKNGFISRANTVHGKNSNKNPSREYRSWTHLKGRCFCETDHAFNRYGGRGITVCERWLKFENFLADMGPCPPGLTIERIDNNGNYEPGNCRWASYLEQGANTRRCKFLTFNGETYHVSEWARRLGVSEFLIYHRIRVGWTPERALTVPARPIKKRKSLSQGMLF